MRKTIILCIAASLLIGWGAFLPAAESAEAVRPSPAACPAVGAVRELGLLVLGVGWEAVRIVLPSCPAKEKDIDALIGGTPSDQ
jgi:hypothetical protein